MGDLSGLTAVLSAVLGAVNSIIYWFFALPLWLIAIVAGGAWVGFILLRRHLRK